MKIVDEKPPIYKALVDAGMQPSEGTLYAYGDKIYNPSGGEIPPDLIVHEEKHIKQQYDLAPIIKHGEAGPSTETPDRDLEQGAEIWWKRYVEDEYFRLEQELQAYAAQFRYVCKFQKDRNARSKILLNYAAVLSGPMYGNMVSHMGAYEMIKDKANIPK